MNEKIEGEELPAKDDPHHPGGQHAHESPGGPHAHGARDEQTAAAGR